MKQEYTVNIRYDVEQINNKTMTRYIEKQFDLLRNELRVKSSYNHDGASFEYIVFMDYEKVSKLLDNIFEEAKKNEFKLNVTTAAYIPKLLILNKNKDEIQSYIDSHPTKDSVKVIENEDKSVSIEFQNSLDQKLTFSLLNKDFSDIQVYNDYNERSIINRNNLKATASTKKPF